MFASGYTVRLNERNATDPKGEGGRRRKR